MEWLGRVAADAGATRIADGDRSVFVLDGRLTMWRNSFSFFGAMMTMFGRQRR